jgi:uncharacterized protein (DUF427 family)
MGLAWQQGPLATGSVGRFLTAEPLPQRLLYAEPLRRRMQVMFDGEWIADSEDVVLLHEPARYPVAYFPKADVVDAVLHPAGHASEHQDLGATTWYAVRHGEHESPRGAWEHTALPAHAEILAGRVAFAWHAMDGFYEEQERVLGHASDAYHRIDIRQTARHLTVHAGDRPVAESDRALVLFESGFAPRWYIPREDIAAEALIPVERQTFCPYKGLCSYFDVAGVARAGWAYLEPYREVDRVAGHISFEPDKVTITIDGRQLLAEPGQNVVSHGPDRGLTVDEVTPVRPRPA